MYFWPFIGATHVKLHVFRDQRAVLYAHLERWRVPVFGPTRKRPTRLLRKINGSERRKRWYVDSTLEPQKQHVEAIIRHNGKWGPRNEERCISSWKMVIFQPAMLVFYWRVIHSNYLCKLMVGKTIRHIFGPIWAYFHGRLLLNFKRIHMFF